MRAPRESEFTWFTRAVILGLMAWAGTTLLSVDTRMEVLEWRMTMIEINHYE